VGIERTYDSHLLVKQGLMKEKLNLLMGTGLNLGCQMTG